MVAPRLYSVGTAFSLWALTHLLPCCVLLVAQALRDQVALLSWLCHCSPPLGGPAGRCAWEGADPGFPRGHGLLSYLHTHLMQADSTAEPLLRYLFAGALRPFMRQVRRHPLPIP